MNDESYISIGRISQPYGVKGWLKILSFTEFFADIIEYQPWYLQIGNEWKQLDTEEVREHGKGLIAKFAGIDTPEQARMFSGKTLAIPRSQLPVLEKNEHYCSDLEGLTVIDQNNRNIGTVIYVMATGSNDVLVVKGDKEFAIPYLSHVISSVDLVKKEIHVNWDII